MVAIGGAVAVGLAQRWNQSVESQQLATPAHSEPPTVPAQTMAPSLVGPLREDLGALSDAQAYLATQGLLCWSTGAASGSCADEASGIVITLTENPVTHAQFTAWVEEGDVGKLEVMATWIGRFLGSRGVTDDGFVDWLAHDVFAPIALGESVDESATYASLNFGADWDSARPIAEIVIAIAGSDPLATGTARCTFPLRSMADVASCQGGGTVFEASVPGTDGRQIVRVAVDSRDNDAIVAALADVFRRYWSSSNPLTVYGYGSADEYQDGFPYSRGRVVTDSSVAEFTVCTAWHDPPVDSCSDEASFRVPLFSGDI